jgi:hypothetical protein
MSFLATVVIETKKKRKRRTWVALKAMFKVNSIFDCPVGAESNCCRFFQENFLTATQIDVTKPNIS